jgi:hypothetical protein
LFACHVVLAEIRLWAHPQARHRLRAANLSPWI